MTDAYTHYHRDILEDPHYTTLDEALMIARRTLEKADSVSEKMRIKQLIVLLINEKITVSQFLEVLRHYK